MKMEKMKMEKTTTCNSLLVISLLIGFYFITQPIQQANAVSATVVDFTMPTANNQSWFMNSTSYYVTVDKTLLQTTAKMTYSIVTSVTTTQPTVNTITLAPRLGGCDPVNNPCSSSTGSANCPNNSCAVYSGNNWKGSLGGLWCGITECFTNWISGNASQPSQLLRVNMVTAGGTIGVDGYMNITAGQTVRPLIWGVDLATGGIGGITLFRIVTSGITDTIYKTGGTSLMNNVANTVNSADGRVPISISGCWFCGGVIATKRVIVSVQCTSANDICIRSFDETLTGKCTGVVTPWSAVANAGSIRYSGNTKNGWIYANDATVYNITLDGCAVVPTGSNAVTYASFGLQNYIRGFDIDDAKHLYYIYHGSGQSAMS